MNLVRYECIEGPPPSNILEQITTLNDELFGLGESKATLATLFNDRPISFISLAFVQAECVGFKAGFRESSTLFESWRGGVSASWRGRGIAKMLMTLQHEWVEANGFKRIRTVTHSNNQPMLILNLKSGFEIVGTLIDQNKRFKIILEKRLELLSTSS